MTQRGDLMLWTVLTATQRAHGVISWVELCVDLFLATKAQGDPFFSRVSTAIPFVATPAVKKAEIVSIPQSWGFSEYIPFQPLLYRSPTAQTLLRFFCKIITILTLRHFQPTRPLVTAVFFANSFHFLPYCTGSSSLKLHRKNRLPPKYYRTDSLPSENKCTGSLSSEFPPRGTCFTRRNI